MEPNPYEAPRMQPEIRPTLRERENDHNLVYLTLILTMLAILAGICILPAVLFAI